MKQVGVNLLYDKVSQGEIKIIHLIMDDKNKKIHTEIKIDNLGPQFLSMITS